ncbi:MAG: sulfotransferase family 2 domain-containing protein [Alphaproteobacteria bacterium]|nr:sulfotransferase family 2 domain-containing protein [Alphaproteobacteria bacterium]
MRRDVVFVHIPKTAGSSLRAMLERAARDHTVLRDYGKAKETTPELYDLVHAKGDVAAFRETFGRKKGILLSGHFPARRYWDFFNAESFVTFLRDPVDRVVSEYNHFVNHHGWTRGFEAFVTAPQYRNAMTRHLAGVDLESFGYIGLMESFESDLPRLCAYLGAELPLQRRNRGDYSELPLPDGHRETIAALNADDAALYERVRAMPRGPRAPEADGYIGRVALTGGGIAKGYLCHRQREFIVEMEILADGRVAGCVKAERFNRAAKARGLSRSGMCGFWIDLGDYAPAEEYRFRARGTEYELPGSPLLP